MSITNRKMTRSGNCFNNKPQCAEESLDSESVESKESKNKQLEENTLLEEVKVNGI